MNFSRYYRSRDKYNCGFDPNIIIKDPYVFEVLGIPEDKPMLESDLEAFASKYVLYMPDKQQLILQVEKVIARWRNKDAD